jgi:alpha-D-ribose 1-methylphosphonate 5-triphosphate synthase subunit PhnH
MTPEVLSGGFADAPVDAAHAFRAALDAMARPGRIVMLAGARPPAPLPVATGVLILTLTDATTPLHLAGEIDTPAVRDWVTFHTGAPLVPAAGAVFAAGDWPALQPLNRFRVGEPAWPDRSATLFVTVPALSPPNARLSGPGIDGAVLLALPDIAAFQANRQLFPLGLDCFLIAGDRVAGVPRSAHVEAL